MTNAKQEFIIETQNDKVICAKIILQSYTLNKTSILKPNHTPEEFIEFVNSLDYEYDAGYGTQHLFGIILYDGGWLERHEYDGSESWSRKNIKTPEDVLKFEVQE